MATSIQKIRPAARLLNTIGQDLIKDKYAALVELVKNAYDADSPDVCIEFIFSKKNSRLLILVKDHGCGMSFDTVVNNWLVPATDDKFIKRRSAKGRVLQGRKGIGRFAATVLGDRMLLETTQNRKTVTLILDMDNLKSIKYLDQLELDVSLVDTEKEDGTIVEIEKDNVTEQDAKNEWTSKQLHKLLLELRSLLSPEDVFKAALEQGYKIDYDSFNINLSFKDFPNEEFANKTISISPFPVLDLYDYRIWGTVNTNGVATLKFENQNFHNLPAEEFQLKINFEIDNELDYPGEVFIDLRAYDREPESIENIIRRGLKDPDTGEFLGKQEAKKILDQYYGVGIFREQFRIRPYGEQSFDWLDLDKKRVQNPSYKIGHNQIIGFVFIKPEEESKLTEKSARDGLTENRSYYGLIHIVSRFINELEARRYDYREKTQKGGRRRTIDDEINLLFDFDNVTRKINRELDEQGIPRRERETVGKIVSEALESEKLKKSDTARKIKDTLAIYQGQATLGKITHVLLHEGRKHIKYITETVPRIIKWSKELAGINSGDLSDKIDDRSNKVISHTKGISYLFKKIEPLARTRRMPAARYNLPDILSSSFEIFSSELNDLEITFDVEVNTSSVSIIANETDLVTIFSNLIENSIYWLKLKKEGIKKIHASIYSDNENLVVEFSDNGPGFQGDNLSLMFEPGYSTKPDGTGLGLALAGDAIARIGGSIEAKSSDSGALFTILFKGKN